MACRFGSSPFLIALLGLAGVPIAQAQEVQPQPDSKKIAFVVGVDGYADPGLSRLHYAANDAAEMAQTLRNLGFSVNTLIGRDATRFAVLRALRALIEQARPDGLTLFYFSGHGFSLSGKGYLAFSDTDSHASDRSGLSIEELQHQMRLARGKNILILDACDSGASASTKAKSALGAGLGETSSSFALYSASADGVSYESDALRHGLFTYYVLRGLRGEAADRSGTITWRGLAEYETSSVSKEMLSRGLRHSNVTNAGSGDFVLGAARPDFGKTEIIASNPANRSTDEDIGAVLVDLIPNGAGPDTTVPELPSLFNLFQSLRQVPVSPGIKPSTPSVAAVPSGSFCINPAALGGGRGAGDDPGWPGLNAPKSYMPLFTSCSRPQPAMPKISVTRVSTTSKVSVEGQAADTQGMSILIRASDAANAWHLRPNGWGWATYLPIPSVSGAGVFIGAEDRRPYLVTAFHVLRSGNNTTRYSYDAANHLTTFAYGRDATAIAYAYDSLGRLSTRAEDGGTFLVAQAFPPPSAIDLYYDRPPPQKALKPLASFPEVDRQEMMRVWDHAVHTRDLAAFRRVCDLYPDTVYYAMALEEMAKLPYAGDTLRSKGPATPDPARFPWDDKIAAFGFGTLFVAIMLVLAVWIREPTPTQWFVFRVVLSLAAAGIGAIIPGLIQVDIHPYIRAGGAIALFVIVYWFNPPKLVAGGEPATNRRSTRTANPTRAGKL
jgi:hypothetical protein